VRGYGANQNAAFAETQAPYFCVLNPDIRLKSNPFPALIAALSDQSVALVSPKILALSGAEEDSARRFPTLRGLLGKAFGATDGTYGLSSSDGIISPDWLAGMFLLIKAGAYRSVGGFDETFFLYYEDVDLCSRLRKSGYEIRQDRAAEVIHDARRESRRSWKFARWHLASMARYLWKNRAL
jgi:GT2 family glycosyltransferase